MLEDEVAEGIQAVLDAVARSGKPFQVRGSELNCRCPVCGDSTRSSFSRHLYINLEYPHPAFCQRCGYRSSELTVELLEGLGADEREAGAYARAISKERRTAGRGRRRGPRLGLARDRMAIPLPNRSDPDDRAAIEYVERRLGIDLSEREIARYKIVATGLYSFLDANGFTSDRLTVPRREADRLNDTCVGFVSADYSHVVFRTMDDAFVARGGRRYTNYKIFEESQEGSKAFCCQADVDLLAPRHRIVQCEGVLDLIGAERAYYPDERWEPHFVGAANNGSSHGTTLRMLIGLGIIGPDVDLHIDNEPADPGRRSNLERVRRMLAEESPFFRAPSFRPQVWWNEFGEPGTKRDFGVPAALMDRRRLAV